MRTRVSQKNFLVTFFGLKGCAKFIFCAFFNLLIAAKNEEIAKSCFCHCFFFFLLALHLLLLLFLLCFCIIFNDVVIFYLNYSSPFLLFARRFTNILQQFIMFNIFFLSFLVFSSTRSLLKFKGIIHACLKCGF